MLSQTPGPPRTPLTPKAPAPRAAGASSTRAAAAAAAFSSCSSVDGKKLQVQDVKESASPHCAVRGGEEGPLLSEGHFRKDASSRKHDAAELYQALLEQLPGSPVIDSVLLAHRGVLEDCLSETPEESLESLDQRIARWRKDKEFELDKLYAARRNDEEFENSTFLGAIGVSDEKREAKIHDFMMRLEALESAVKKDVDRVVDRRSKHSLQHSDKDNGSKNESADPKDFFVDGLGALTAADGGPPLASPFRKEWELLQIKKKERETEAREECVRLAAVDDKRLAASAAIAFASELAKLGINEQINRCAIYSEQEKGRLVLKREMGLRRERLRAVDDSLDFIDSFVLSAEKTAFAQLQEEFTRKGVVRGVGE